MRRKIAVVLLALAPVATLQRVEAAGPPDARESIAEQRRAMAPLANFDGTWRGPATATLADGRRVELTQTERVGGFLGGSLKLIEGKGYAADGNVVFNAFGVISFSPQTGKYSFRSYAQGQSGDFAIEVTADSFVWTIDAGSAKIRYTATVKDGVWSEFGERIVAGQTPVRIYEMALKRIGNTDWPEAGASAN
ncbi:MAG: DUF1579 domain-containing protein [Burkholderiaceae bacterium]